MKPLVTISFAIIVIFSLYSCVTGIPLTKQAPPNNKTYEVEYLFEYDGCKVYRFIDSGHTVYFTNCTGEVTSMRGDSTESRVINVIKTKP
ncbi:MAG: DUF4884 domain-containing protein [Bacteroidales bacterium]|nr:DUF4884 domain-containing protein [Bacteroidales bacterium]